MATLSGSILFDRERTADANRNHEGIANVPVILQNTSTNAALAVLTDSSGRYSFTNVPEGDYRIVESYGTVATETPGDFKNAIEATPAVSAFPPISFAPGPPIGATNLDALTPTTLLVKVDGSDKQNLNILNGPVTYTPISAISDSGLIINPHNLIDKPGRSDFGSFPQGTPPNTGAQPNPYPDLGSEFEYTQPNTAYVSPAYHQYTIQNIMTNAVANEQYTWWRVADHTTGNETGRMMVINGDAPGSVIYEQRIDVKPDNYYLFSSWIMNMSRSAALVDPKLGVQVLDENKNILYSATLGAMIPMNSDNPEWKQIGTVINSGANNALTLRFTSMGPEANGNDYAIDDISLNEVKVTAYDPTKSANVSSIEIGETVEYTIELHNTGTTLLTNVTVSDAIPEGFAFVPGSVVINGTPAESANPAEGFPAPDIAGGEKMSVTFSALAKHVPATNPTVNEAKVKYSYSPVKGGIHRMYDTTSNPVLVRIAETDLSLTKAVDKSKAHPGEQLIYTITAHNNSQSEAQNTVISDPFPASIINPEYSFDDGATWHPWQGSLGLGTAIPETSIAIKLRGTISETATGEITNTATITSLTHDSNPDNNSATANTTIEIIPKADVIATKRTDKNEVKAGDSLTYTLTVLNEGPDEAQNVVLNDAIPAALSSMEYSTDGGVVWGLWPSSLALGNMPSGASREVKLRGRVNDSATGMITNKATVTSLTLDPNPGNNSATVNTPIEVSVIPQAHVIITKKANKNQVKAGEPLTYTLTILNEGPDEAQEVVLNDIMPAALTSAEYSADFGVNWVPFNGILALGNMPKDVSHNILIRGIVSAHATGQIMNTVSVSSKTVNPKSDGGTATEITPIVEPPQPPPPLPLPPPPPLPYNPCADISVIKAANQSVTASCQQLIYTMTISNAGPSDALDTVLIDVMPKELNNAEYSADGGNTWQVWGGSLNLGTLPAGTSVMILIRVLVIVKDKWCIINTAEVHSITPDYNMANNRSEVIVAVKHQQSYHSGFQIPTRSRTGCEQGRGFYISK